MKRLAFVVMGVLITMAALMALSAGCTSKAAKPTQNATGILKEVNTPAEPGKDVVTIQTPQGLQTFTLTADTTYSLKGQACALEDVGKVLGTANATYQCNLYYDDQLNAVNLTVWQSVDPLKNPN